MTGIHHTEMAQAGVFPYKGRSLFPCFPISDETISWLRASNQLAKTIGDLTMRRACIVTVTLMIFGCSASPDRKSPATAEPITEQQAYEIGYAVIPEKLGYQPPGRDKWKYWTVRCLREGDRSSWHVGVDLAPAGGGDHAYAIIDATTGEVIRAEAGRHLR